MSQKGIELRASLVEDDCEIVSKRHSFSHSLSKRLSRPVARFRRLPRRTRRAVVCCTVTLVTLVLLVLVGYFAIAPLIVQQYADGATFTFNSVELTQPEGMTKVMFICDITVHTQTPVDVQSRPAPATVWFNGTLLGTSQLPSIKLAAGHSESNFTLHHDMLIESTQAFDALSMQMLYSAKAEWVMMATTTLTATLPGGLELTYHNIKLKKHASLPGADGLHVQLLGFDIQLTEQNDALFLAQTSMYNPSVISLHPVGNVTLNTFVDSNSFLSQITMVDVELTSGMNYVNASGVILPANMSRLDTLIQTYLSGQSNVVKAVGASPGASSVPLYEHIFENLSLDLVMPGMTHQLIVAAIITMDGDQIIAGVLTGHLVVPIKVAIDYPMTASTTIVGLNIVASYRDQKTGVLSEIGSFDDESLSPTIVVPGHASNFLTRSVGVDAKLDTKDVQDYWSALGSELKHGLTHISIKGTIKFECGNIRANPFVVQADIPTCNPLSLDKCGIKTDWGGHMPLDRVQR